MVHTRPRSPGTRTQGGGRPAPPAPDRTGQHLRHEIFRWRHGDLRPDRSGPGLGHRTDNSDTGGWGLRLPCPLACTWHAHIIIRCMKNIYKPIDCLAN